MELKYYHPNFEVVRKVSRFEDIPIGEIFSWGTCQMILRKRMRDCVRIDDEYEGESRLIRGGESNQYYILKNTQEQIEML